MDASWIAQVLNEDWDAICLNCSREYARLIKPYLKMNLVNTELNQPSPIFLTSAWIASADASGRKSMISALPAGLSTRCISLRARIGSAKFLKAAWQMMKSNESGSNGMAEALPCS